MAALPTPRIRWKVFLLLAAGVLLAHWLLLRSVASSLGQGAADAPLRFDTRTLLPTPTPVQAAARPPARPRHTPARPPVPPLPLPAPPVAPPSPPQSASVDPVATGPAVADLGPTDSAAALPEAVTQAAPDAPAALPERPPRDDAVTFKVDMLPASTRLTYLVLSNKFPFSLTGELLWQQASLHYQARMTFSAFGQARVQTSRGVIDDAGLAPERFSDKYRSEVAAHFNRAQGKVTFSANTPDLPLLSGAQDRLSVLLQLGALVASDPGRFGPGMTLTIQTIGPRAGDLWLFTVEKTELLDLPGGAQQAVKLVRNPREAYDQRVEIWLAPALSYLPVRVRVTETNADYIDQQWQSAEPASAPD